MVIGIDASQAIKEQKTGVQWYSYHLLLALKSIVPPLHRVRLYTPTPLPAVFRPLPPHWEEKVLPWPFQQGWTLCRLSRELRRDPPDVFFSPGHIIPPFIPCKTMVTIHDLGFRDFPRAYAHSRLMNFLHARDARIAHTIITPSNATRDAVMQAYAINPGKIHVIPHGYDADIYHPYDEQAIQQALDHYGIKKPYVISVGRLEEKKNTMSVLQLIQAFRHAALDSASRTNDLQLVLVGSRGYGYKKIQQWIEENHASNWIHELGWLPSKDTAMLISGASALIAFSRIEGFGLTILEAIACNTPILASDIPPHREIGQNLITYTDPNNLTESTNGLINLINHDARRALSTLAPLSVNSVEWSLVDHTWSYSAQQTLNILLQFSAH